MGIERLLKGDTCAYINHMYPIIFKVHVVYSKSTDRTYQSTLFFKKQARILYL